MSNQGPAAQGSDTEIVRTLRAARALIAADGGWGKGNGSNLWPYNLAKGCFCADTAIHFVSTDSTEAQAFIRRAAGFNPDVHDEFYEWHDAPERTQAEIVALFDRAIALAEGNAAQPPSASDSSLVNTAAADRTEEP